MCTSLEHMYKCTIPIQLSIAQRNRPFAHPLGMILYSTRVFNSSMTIQYCTSWTRVYIGTVQYQLSCFITFPQFSCCRQSHSGKSSSPSRDSPQSVNKSNPASASLSREISALHSSHSRLHLDISEVRHHRISVRSQPCSTSCFVIELFSTFAWHFCHLRPYAKYSPCTKQLQLLRARNLQQSMVCSFLAMKSLLCISSVSFSAHR